MRENIVFNEETVAKIKKYVNNPYAYGRISPWRVCARELYVNCLGGTNSGYSKTYFACIKNIMDNITGWEWDTHKSHHMAYLDKQKCWVNNTFREKYSPYKKKLN